MWGSSPDLDPSPDPYFNYNFWGSTPSLAAVPSMSHLRSCGGQVQIWIPLQIHILIAIFESPLHLWLKSYLCLMLDHVGGSTPDLDPSPDPYLGCNFWESTPSLAAVPYMSHLRSCGGQPWIWIHLQIHIWVVLFESPLHLWLQSHLCLTLDHVGGQLWIWIHLKIHILIAILEGPLHLWLQSHLCLTLDHVGVKSKSGSISRSIFVL